MALKRDFNLNRGRNNIMLRLTSKCLIPSVSVYSVSIAYQFCLAGRQWWLFYFPYICTIQRSHIVWPNYLFIYLFLIETFVMLENCKPYTSSWNNNQGLFYLINMKRRAKSTQPFLHRRISCGEKKAL